MCGNPKGVSGIPLEGKHLDLASNRSNQMILEMIDHPGFFTGDLPLNSIVGLDCSNRSDQMPFINAINEAKHSHDDDR